MRCSEFFSALWLDYIQQCPQANIIHHLLEQDGNTVVNDHVAFRTYNLSPIAIENLEPQLLTMGYAILNHYSFEDKYLDARAYIHQDKTQPKIFLSELRVEALSDASQAIIKNRVSLVDKKRLADPSVFWQGRLWPIGTYTEYQTLLSESEYAAWFFVFGLRANHFTVNINALSKGRMDYVIQCLKKAGIPLNKTGGVVKGTRADCLIQSASLADKVITRFSSGEEVLIPSCFYEFAERFVDDSGALFQGFVPNNADKIFHSTDAKGSS